MYSTDDRAFAEILDRLGTVFGKPVTDDMRKFYWDSLKDRHIASVRECATKHERFGKFFPKPFELRPKDDKPPIDTPAASEEAIRRTVRNLESLRSEDPEKWEAEVRARRNARILATTFVGTPEHEAARRVDQELRKTAGWVHAR